MLQINDEYEEGCPNRKRVALLICWGDLHGICGRLRIGHDGFQDHHDQPGDESLGPRVSAFVPDRPDRWFGLAVELRFLTCHLLRTGAHTTLTNKLRKQVANKELRPNYADYRMRELEAVMCSYVANW